MVCSFQKGNGGGVDLAKREGGGFGKSGGGEILVSMCWIREEEKEK